MDKERVRETLNFVTKKVESCLMEDGKLPEVINDEDVHYFLIMSILTAYLNGELVRKDELINGDTSDFTSMPMKNTTENHLCAGATM